MTDDGDKREDGDKTPPHTFRTGEHPEAEAPGEFEEPFINLDDFDVDEEYIAMIPREIAQQHRLIPLSICTDDGTLIVAMSSPTDRQALNALGLYICRPILPIRAEDAAIENAIHRFYDVTPPIAN